MMEAITPIVLENYYSELTLKKTSNSIPKCPICKLDMNLEGFEPIFTSAGDGYIRRFRCMNCVDKDVILWRK